MKRRNGRPGRVFDHDSALSGARLVEAMYLAGHPFNRALAHVRGIMTLAAVCRERA